MAHGDLPGNIDELTKLMREFNTSIKEVQQDNKSIAGRLAELSDKVEEKSQQDDNRGASHTAGTYSFGHPLDGTRPKSSPLSNNSGYLAGRLDPGSVAADTSVHQTPAGDRVSAPRSFELSQAYRAIQDRWKGVKLEPEYLFCESRQSIDPKDRALNGFLSRCARIVETCLRVFSVYSDTDGLSAEAGNDLFIALVHLMRTLQDKQVHLVVSKNYDRDFAAQYMSIMTGSDNMRLEHIQALNMTQSVLQHREVPRTGQFGAYSGRARGRGGRGRGSNNNYRGKGRGRFGNDSEDTATQDE